MEKLPLTVQTLYADLVQKIAGRTGVIEASVVAKKVKNRAFLYAVKRVGKGREQVYLGPADDPEVKKRAEAIRRETEASKDRRNTIRMLKAAGIDGPNRAVGGVLEAISRTGLFDEGLVLVGTVAFQTYPLMLGVRLSDTGLMTQDVDFVAATTSIAMATSDRDEQRDLDFLSILRRADPTFRDIPQLDPRKPSSRFVSDERFEVELLTPVRSRNERNPVALPRLNAGAIPLHYLEYLVEGAGPAVIPHGSGVKVTTPAPERYAVHKLIVAQNRGAFSAKKSKDLAQARTLMDALGDSMALSDAMDDARGRGPKWRKAIDASLRELARV